MRKKSVFSTILGYVLLFLIVTMMINVLNENTTKDMSYTELMNKISKTEVESVEVSEDKASAKVKLKDTKEVIRVVKIPDSAEFNSAIRENVKNGEFEIKVGKTPILMSILAIFPDILMLVVCVLFFVLFMQQAGQGNNKAMSFGKSKAKLADPNAKNKTMFKDVAGSEEEKEELEEVVDFLKEPKRFEELGARIPKGILLVGSPGTGKTLLAKAVAGEAGVPFFSISGSDFVEMFVGVGASRVRDLFEEGKKNGPCIIFIDEIDAVGRQRGAGLGGGHDEREQTLNQLLVEMDGFGQNDGIIVIAATNRPDILDKALLRPGRFDRQIVVHEPDIRAREEIIKLHAANKPMVENMDFKVIAKNTAGFTGADLANMINESALLAARKNKKQIDIIDVEEAVIKVMMGPEKKSKVVSEKERRLTAFHEAGHAVVSRFLPTHDTVHQISIIPRGMTGGYTMYKPNEDKSYNSKSEMLDHIVSLLGGRVSEKLVLNDISTGASNDIERASKIARAMVMKYGMSDKLGPIAYGGEQEEVFLGRDFNQQRNFSEKIASQIDEEVMEIIQTAYLRAKTILTDHMEQLHVVAEILLEKEKMESAEFEAVFNSKKEKVKKNDKSEKSDNIISKNENLKNKDINKISKQAKTEKAEISDKDLAKKTKTKKED
ncbi:MAG: ATP-dependent zinc metalloprotease FtsH [Clostridia bacterium]